MEVPPPVPAETNAQTSPRMSLLGRMFNVFATPGEVFEEVRVSPVNHANWIVPGSLVLVLGVVGAWLVFSQPAIQQQMKEMTAAAMEQQFSKMNLPPERMEEMRESTEKIGSIAMQASVYLKPVFAGLVSPFLWALFVWLVGAQKYKQNFGYLKALEVMGLTTMVAALHFALLYLLIIVTGNFFAGPSLVLLLKDFDATNPLHTLLTYADVVWWWLVIVRGIGLARLSKISAGKGILWAFVFWIAYNAMMVGPGLLAQALSGK